MDQSMASPLQVTPMLIFMFFFAKMHFMVCNGKDIYILWPQLFSLQTSLGVIGVAWVGTLCKKNGRNAGLNEKLENVLATSEVSTLRSKVTIHRILKKLSGWF